MILKVGLRREWPVLHNEAAKYFLVLILKVARSKKLSLVDQCIENVASMAALNSHPPATHPPTRPHLPENIFLLSSEEHTSELKSRSDIVCRLLLEKKNGRRN